MTCTQEQTHSRNLSFLFVRSLSTCPHTLNKTPAGRLCVSGGVGFMRAGSQACQLQSRSALCFLAKLPTNPIPWSPPPTHNSLTMQSLLNYKARLKRDPAQHNSVFLHDSPITVREGGPSAHLGKERRKECVRMNGPSAECGKLGR